jgi:hypothetical protein
MSRTPEQRALSLLESMASEAVIKAAKRAVTDGTHTWQQDPVFEGIGLDGEEKARVALIQMSEALIEQLSPAEDEVTTRR